MDSLVLRDLPVADPATLALLSDGAPSALRQWSHPVFQQIAANSDLCGGVAAWSAAEFDISGGGKAQFVNGLWVSGSFFETLGVHAVIGRTLGESDGRRIGGPQTGAAAVMSYRFWQRRYGGRADVLGQTLLLNNVPFTIVGVAPAEFFGPEVGAAFDIAVRIATEPLVRGKDSLLEHSGASFLSVMLRTRPGQSLTGCEAALRGIQSRVRSETLGELAYLGNTRLTDGSPNGSRVKPGVTTTRSVRASNESGDNLMPRAKQPPVLTGNRRAHESLASCRRSSTS